MTQQTALQVMLEVTRQFQRMAREAMEGTNPDPIKAKKWMKKAKSSGRKAAPYVATPMLRDRITAGDQPIGEQEWDKLLLAEEAERERLGLP